MSILLKTIGNRYNNYMINVGRQRSRSVLMNQSTRTLQDMGISRSLLEKGVAYWPWREADQPMPAKSEQLSQRAEAKAIRELRALSDHDLRDIGITRGEIVSAVRYGRAGVQATTASSRVLEQLARDSISTASVGRDDVAANTKPENTPEPTSPTAGSNRQVAA